MKNKLYILIIIVLLPFTVKALQQKELIEEVVLEKPKEEIKEKELVVNLKLNNEIISMNLEEYIIGVVGAEVPASFNMEALKAQAVAARTYTIHELKNKDYMTLGMQAYKTNTELKNIWNEYYDKYYNKIKEAVYSTKNEIITYEGKPIKAYYYSMSNGKTEDSVAVFNEDLPYIETVLSVYDNTSIKNFYSEKTINREEFCNKLNINCEKITINNIVRDTSDRVSKITINNKVYTGVEIRKLLSLRSTDFNIEIDNNIKISTKGYGHGVGMSQYGANGMANNNYNYKEILKHYYKDVEITNYNV